MTAVSVEPGVVLSAPMSAALEYLCWSGAPSPLPPLAGYTAAAAGVDLTQAGEALCTLIDLGYVRETKAGALDPLYHLTDSGRDLACQPDEQEEAMTDLTEVKPDPKPEKAPVKKKTSPRTQAAKTVAAKDAAAEIPPPVVDVTGQPNESLAPPDTDALARQFTDAVLAAVPDGVVDQKQSYVRIVSGGNTACYIRQSRHGLRIGLDPLIRDETGIADVVAMVAKAVATN